MSGNSSLLGERGVGLQRDRRAPEGHGPLVDGCGLDLSETDTCRTRGDQRYRQSARVGYGGALTSRLTG